MKGTLMNDKCKLCEHSHVAVWQYPCRLCCFSKVDQVSFFEPKHKNDKPNPFDLGDK